VEEYHKRSYPLHLCIQVITLFIHSWSKLATTWRFYWRFYCNIVANDCLFYNVPIESPILLCSVTDRLHDSDQQCRYINGRFALYENWKWMGNNLPDKLLGALPSH
jgi:hypothetical protein